MISVSGCFQYLACILLLLACAVLSFGQAGDSCPEIEGNDIPKYRIGYKGYTSEPDKILLLYVSVDPKAFDRTSMASLALRIRSDFCLEKRISAILFHDFKIAKRFVPHPHSPTYKIDMKSIQGGYRLDRVKGTEYISFVPLGGSEEIRIDLNPSEVHKSILNSDPDNECSCTPDRTPC